jgi:hypothetical protein
VLCDSGCGESMLVLSVFAFGFLVALLGRTNPDGNCCLSCCVAEGIPLPVCFAQSIHSLLLKSGLRVGTGCKVLIFNDLLLQSIPSMALNLAKEEEDVQVLGVVPGFYFTLSVKGWVPDRRCSARFLGWGKEQTTATATTRTRTTTTTTTTTIDLSFRPSTSLRASLRPSAERKGFGVVWNVQAKTWTYPRSNDKNNGNDKS